MSRLRRSCRRSPGTRFRTISAPRFHPGNPAVARPGEHCPGSRAVLPVLRAVDQLAESVRIATAPPALHLLLPAQGGSSAVAFQALAGALADGGRRDGGHAAL